LPCRDVRLAEHARYQPRVQRIDTGEEQQVDEPNDKHEEHGKHWAGGAGVVVHESPLVSVILTNAAASRSIRSHDQFELSLRAMCQPNAAGCSPTEQRFNIGMVDSREDDGPHELALSLLVEVVERAAHAVGTLG